LSATAPLRRRGDGGRKPLFCFGQHVTKNILYLVYFIPKKNLSAIRIVALVATFLSLVLTSYMWLHYDYSLHGINMENQFQFVEHFSWISTYHIEYFIGVDGLSFPMIWLSSLLSFFDFYRFYDFFCSRWVDCRKFLGIR